MVIYLGRITNQELHDSNKIGQLTDLNSTNKDSVVSAINEIKNDSVTHLTDYVRQPGYGTTAGTSTAYTLNLNPALTSYTSGVAIAIKMHTDCGNTPTININDLGVKNLKKQDGTAYSASDLVTGSIYTFRYDGTDFLADSSAGGLQEFFGDGSDGAFNSSDDVTWTVTEEDVTTVVKQFTSFTLNEGHTLAVDKRCRGVVVYVNGNVVINGKINMDKGSASYDPATTSPLTIPLAVSKLLNIDTEENSIFVPKRGGTGGSGGNGGGWHESTYYDDTGYGTRSGGEGGKTIGVGYFFGGSPGCGGGGGAGNCADRGKGGDGGNNREGLLGAGGYGTGDGDGGNGGIAAGGGGSGDNWQGGPGATKGGGGGGGGTAQHSIYNPPPDGDSIGGGLLVIICNGNITIGSSGIISSNGGNGGNGQNTYLSDRLGAGGGGGGGAGGGVIYLLYKGAYTNNGSITVNGGSGGTAGGSRDNDYIRTASNGSGGSVGVIVTQQLE